MKETRMFQRACYTSGRILKNHSPTILSVIGIFGVIGTAVLTAAATPKAIERIRADSCINHDGNPNAFTKKEAFESAWKFYIPAALTGTSTILCIMGANVLNRQQQASLASAYAFMQESYQNYRKAAKSVYGEEADSKIVAEMAKDTFVHSDGYSLYLPDKDSDSEKLLFYDMFSQRYFNATLASVLNAQYHVNRNLQIKGEICINEFYEFLGIDGMEDGDIIGWNLDKLMEDGYVWLDFENRFAEIDSGLECRIISAAWLPGLLCEE